MADGVAEASWLAALVVTPLLVDTASDQPFEGTKGAALRLLALTATAAFAVGVVTRWRNPAGGERAPTADSGPRARWLAAVAVLGGMLAASTALSLSPETSLFGSPHRALGLTTMLAAMAIGVVAACSIRSPAQVQRALAALVVAAVPVAGAAVAEHHGWTMLPRTEPVPRAASTLGNPMALGGYLVFVLPLALARLAGAVDGWRTPGRRRTNPAVVVGTAAAVSAVAWIVGGPLVGTAAAAAVAAVAWLVHRADGRASAARFAGEGAILGLLLAAFVVAGSRGPALGLAAAALVAAAAAWAHGRRRWVRRPGAAWAAGAASAGAVAVAALVARVGGGRLPLLDRAFEASDAPQSTAGVRLALWRTAVDAVGSRTPIGTPESSDPGHPIRLLLGHGLETTDVVLGPHAPPQVWLYERRLAIPDRTHAALFDTVIHTGILGLAAQLAVVALAVAAGLRLLGATGRRPSRAVAACGIGAAVGMAGSAVAGRMELAAVALTAGLVAGLVWHLLTAPRDAPASTGLVPTAVAVAALAGLAGHWVEAQFAFPWVATLLLAWFAMAVLVAGAAPRRSHPRLAPRPARPLTQGERRLVGGLGGVSVAVAVLGLGRGETAALVWVAALVVGGVLVVSGPGSGQDGRQLRRLVRSPVAALGVTAAVLVAAGRAALGQGAVPFEPPGEWRAVVFAGLVVGVVAAGAAALRSEDVRGGAAGPPGPLGVVRWSAVGAVGVIAVAAVWWTAVVPAQADHLRLQARTTSDPFAAAELFDRAGRHEPGGGRSAPNGLDLTIRAAMAAGPGSGAVVDPAIEHLMASRARDRFNARHAMALATLYELRAELSIDEPARGASLDQAIRFHEEATGLRPAAGHLWAGLAMALYQRAELSDGAAAGSPSDLRGRAGAALARAGELDPALALVPAIEARFASNWPDAVTGAAGALARLPHLDALSGFYEQRGRSLAHEALDRAQSMAERENAGDAFVAALAAEASDRAVPEVHVALAEARSRHGDTSGALEAIRAALALTPEHHLTARSVYGAMEASMEATMEATVEAPMAAATGGAGPDQPSSVPPASTTSR